MIPGALAFVEVVDRTLVHNCGTIGKMSVSRPIIMPEAFSSEGSFTNWPDHFEGVA